MVYLNQLWFFNAGKFFSIALVYSFLFLFLIMAPDDI